MCCERVCRDFQETANSLADGVADKAVLAEIAIGVKVACPYYLKSHTFKAAYPTSVTPTEMFDAVLSTKPDEYIDVVRRRGLLIAGSETEMLAIQLAKIAQRERQEEVPEFLKKDASEQKTDVLENVGTLVPLTK